MKIKSILFLTLLSITRLANAQGDTEDYNRAYALAKKYNYGRVENANIQPHWIPDSDKFWYVTENSGNVSYNVTDAKTLKETPLFNSEKLAALLQAKTGKEIDAKKFRPEYLRVSSGGNILEFNFDRHRWTYDVKKGTLEDSGALPPYVAPPHWMVVDEEKNGKPAVSPDGKYSAFVRDNNVWVKNQSNGQETQLTKDGTIGNYYSSYLNWSPDGKKIAVNKIRPVEKR